MSSMDTQKYKFAQVFRAIKNSDNPEEDFMNYVLETERLAKRGVIEEMRILLDTLLFEVETEREKSVNDSGGEYSYDDSAYTASWYAGKGVAYKKVENRIRKLLEEINHENSIK